MKYKNSPIRLPNRKIKKADNINKIKIRELRLDVKKLEMSFITLMG